MNKIALGLVAAVHATAAGLLVGALQAPIPAPASTVVQLRLMQAPNALPQPHPPRSSAVKLPAPPWAPWPAPLLPPVAAVELPRPSALPSAPTLDPAVSPAPSPPSPTLASAPPAPPAPPLRAAALPPEHGLCSARGVQRHYPALLRERGIEGQVLLRVQVDEQGRAAEVRVQGGSGWRLLDEAARRIAADCPYVPARRGDQPLIAWVEYPLRFSLH